MKKILIPFLLLLGLTACSSLPTDTASEANNEPVSESTRKIASDFDNTKKLNVISNTSGDYQVSTPIEWVDKNPYFYTTKQSDTRSFLYLSESEEGGFSEAHIPDVVKGFSESATGDVLTEERSLNGIKTTYVKFPSKYSVVTGITEGYIFIDNNDGNVCLLCMFLNDKDPLDHSEDFEKIANTLELLTPETTATPIQEATPEPTPDATPEPKENVTTGMKNALSSALSYLRYSAFSYDSLINQLEYEGYTTEEATYAVDNCGADWNEQSLESALNYLKYSAFSYTGLIGQLEYEGFTKAQAAHGADNCGADWNEQAAKSAESYLKYSAFSRSGLIDQLMFEGFTREQAEYGVSQNGY